MRIKTTYVAFAVLLQLAAGTICDARAQPASLKPVVTFAFFGCNRIDGKDWDAVRSVNPSSANIPQLKQNLTDIATLSPDYVFFGGDLVMGYADDHCETLHSQVTAWISLSDTLPRSARTRFIAISGNHELNRKVGESKLPNPPADDVWSRLVGSARLVPKSVTGPTPMSDPEDALVTDQRKLSFSFDRGPVHFVVLNTDTRVSTPDPKTGETKIGMVPCHWLDSDLDSAEKNPRIKAVIVMGHRNVTDPDSVKGDAPIDPECANRMVESLRAHPKVRAYVCAHVHAFDISLIGGSQVRQVVFGNGGSKLEDAWHPEGGRTYGFGYFKVYSDGSLAIVPYFRPAPQNYMSAEPADVPAAQPEPELLLRPAPSSTLSSPLAFCSAAFSLSPGTIWP